MKKPWILLSVVACFSACDKNGGDSQKPVIDVVSPMANQQFNAGQTINVVATITDNDELHEINLTVVNKNTSAEVVHFHNHIDVRTYNISKSFIAAAATVYTVRVEAEDHAGNYSELEFQVMGN